MHRDEARYRVTAALLQADRPQTLAELVEAARIAGVELPIFPAPGGPEIIRMRGKPPRPQSLHRTGKRTMDNRKDKNGGEGRAITRSTGT